jgi:serine/threonine-protein kinase RsbW
MSAPAPSHLESPPQPAPLRIEVPGRLDAISPAVDRVIAAMQAGCRPGMPEFEVETALREALSNAVRYGCQGDPTKSVELTASCDPIQGITIVVRDQGPGFDPRLIPSPTAGANLYRHHGRGIYLIQQLMDEVTYSERGTVLRMRKR